MNGPRLSVYAERLVRAGIALQVAALEWDRSDGDSILAIEVITATIQKIIKEIKEDS